MSECLIVKGSGETDLPIVHIVHSLEEARHAVLSLMYSNPDDAEDTDELFAEFDDTMADDNYWTIAFEIGGISVERVCLAAPTQGADARPVAINEMYELRVADLMTQLDQKDTARAMLARALENSKRSAIECCKAVETDLRDNWPNTGSEAIVGVERCIKALSATDLATRDAAPSDAQDAERYRKLKKAGAIIAWAHEGPWVYGDAIDVEMDKWIAASAPREET